MFHLWKFGLNWVKFATLFWYCIVITDEIDHKAAMMLKSNFVVGRDREMKSLLDFVQSDGGSHDSLRTSTFIGEPGKETQERTSYIERGNNVPSWHVEMNLLSWHSLACGDVCWAHTVGMGYKFVELTQLACGDVCWAHTVGMGYKFVELTQLACGDVCWAHTVGMGYKLAELTQLGCDDSLQKSTSDHGYIIVVFSQLIHYITNLL